MVKKKSASSPQEKRVPASALFTTPVTDKQRRELQKLADLPDSQIDFSDAPEASPRASDIQVGRFYRPIKQLVSLRVDADVLARGMSRMRTVLATMRLRKLFHLAENFHAHEFASTGEGSLLRAG